MSGCGHDETILAYHDCPVDMPRIHALVIGVGRYIEPRDSRKKPFSNLPGAARAAIRFAKYLIDEFHDPEGRSLGTVRLLLSSLEDEDAELGSLSSGGASTLEVSLALEAWGDDCHQNEKNLAILYVAGHGVALSRGINTLFLSDAMLWGSEYQGSLNLISVDEGMAGCRAKDNIYVYDCCALPPNEISEMASIGGLYMKPFPQPGPREGLKKRDSVVYINAARVGTSTYAIGLGGTLLSRGLLGDFREHTGDDALLLTAGEIVDNNYGITTSRLKEALPTRLMELLEALKGDPRGYEPSVTGNRGPARALTLPQPPPSYTVVLKGLHEGRDLPVSLVIQDGQGAVLREEPNAPDEYSTDLEAGEYFAFVAGAGATGFKGQTLRVEGSRSWQVVG
ncbi:hypothetical protein [Kribbella monticola]|uniref:hypothetical protein n=1 Tax=Kribbella monticola TaxID=2185285 RepID=UPI000DD4573A|nr:hypothetical protein [Kribbella monticola]